MKNITLPLLALFISINAFSQDDKTVTLVVSGSGTTQEEAKQNALRTAIEQAFGTFISAKTEILDDNMVTDQITSVTSGNIQSFEMLNETQLPNGRFATTLKAIVSVDKLVSFVQSKGVVVEVKGGLFTLNIKQQLLNEQGEIDAVCEMVGVLHEPMQTAFDYNLQTGEQKSLDSESQYWGIPIRVSVVSNHNLEVCMEYFQKTIATISLSKSELESYKSLGKVLFPVTISGETYYLRKARSMEALLAFFNNWEFYITNFSVFDGVHVMTRYNTNFDKKNGVEFFNSEVNSNYGQDYFLKKQFNLDREGWRGFDETVGSNNFYERDYEIHYGINVFSGNALIAEYYLWDYKSLSELEVLEKYTVKSNGVVSEFKYGGFVIWQSNGHGLVASLLDIKKDGAGFAGYSSNLYSVLQNHNLNGYNDWRLPTLKEFEAVLTNLVSADISVFHLAGMQRIYSQIDYITSDSSVRIVYQSSLFDLNSPYMIMQIREESARSKANGDTVTYTFEGELSNKTMNLYIREKNYHQFQNWNPRLLISKSKGIYGIVVRQDDIETMEKSASGNIRPVREF